MTEKLLQYIWQFQYFTKNELSTTAGETLHVINPGTFNSNQGPDFLDAKIKVGDTTWAGSIELHISSSHWHLHGHSADKNYKNVILHVVWQDDDTVSGSFPVLELQGKVSGLLLKRYDELMQFGNFIPCEKIIAQVPAITWAAWKERLLVERLLQRSSVITNYLQQNNNHWEETFWWLLAKNFGVVVNSDTFEKIARSLPISILAKHKHQLQQTEALIFGQASMLAGHFSEDYPKMLQKEYAFLQKKYKLQPVIEPVHLLRMRPSNFPAVRLAQLAMLVHNSNHLFSKIKEQHSLKEMRKFFEITANDYWHYHYCFDEPTAFKKKTIGMQMVNSIITNTIVPVLFAYGHHHKEAIYRERAFKLLEEMIAEKNVITNGFAALDVENKNAFDSQALLQLKKHYCDPKCCLACAIGNKLLKTG
ncbi:MAG: DUF2851 family protein [Ferruginibacter sp.]